MCLRAEELKEMVKKMKKTVALIFAAMMVGTLAACGNNAPSSTASAPDTSSAVDSTIVDSGEDVVDSEEPTDPDAGITNLDDLVASLTETEFAQGLSGSDTTGKQIFAAITADNTKGVFAMINTDAAMDMVFGNAVVEGDKTTITDALTGITVTYTTADGEDGNPVITVDGSEIPCVTLDAAGIEGALNTVTSSLGY